MFSGVEVFIYYINLPKAVAINIGHHTKSNNNSLNIFFRRISN